MSEDEFSEENDTEGAVAACDPSIIPIFPVRFALKSETLLAMKGAGAPLPTPPASIDDLSHHELVRIRKGWVYVFHNGNMQVFKFTTYADDENCGIYREDVAQNIEPPYTFTKYQWSDGAASGEWTQEGKQYPFLFVPKDTPEAWVAYSETLWPTRFFDEAENNATFRAKVMVKVDLAARSGDFCAPITDLEKRVPAFRKDSQAFPQKDYTLENAIRHTGVEIERSGRILNCQSTKDTGVLVALHDPVGETQDLLGLMTVYSTTLSNFLIEHQYPLVIGKAVENLNADNEISTSAMLGLFDGPLSKEFEAEYTRLDNTVQSLENTSAALAQCWDNMVARTGFGTLKALEDACETVSNRYSLQNHPLDHTEVIGFWLFLAARVMTAAASSRQIVAILNDRFGLQGAVSLQSAPENKSWLEKLVNATKAVGIAISSGKQTHRIFKPALSAFFTVYGTQVAAASAMQSGSSARRLTTVFFRESVQFHKADELQQAFVNMLTPEGYGAARMPSELEQLGDAVSARTLLTEATGQSGQIGVVEFHAQIDLEFSSSFHSFARRAENFDLGVNGFGLVGATLSVMTTLNARSSANRNVSDIGQIAGGTESQLTAAFAGAYEATYEVTKTIVGRANSAATRTVLAEVFGNNAMLRGAAASNATLGGRAIASKALGWSARAAGAIGVAMSAAMAIEGVQRGDAYMATGNGLMAVGALILLCPIGWGLGLVAVAAIAIGFVVSLFSYSDREMWVKLGFWGTSSSYWDEDRDQDAIQRIADAKVLSNDQSADYSRIKNFFEQEVIYYLDVTSRLTLADDLNKDGKIEIRCGTLQSAADMARLSATAELRYQQPGPAMWVETEDISGIQLNFVSPGVASATIPNGNYDPKFRSVRIHVRLARVPHGGVFQKSLTVQRNTLW
ncbi:hypothetical protein O4H48_22260 [Rhodobacteraceae bacterium G21628-S1]|nr:hypothetical protein [Rhodobacteraceae bacterium G21628-S1]